MSRLCPAGKQLVSQVRQVDPDVVATASDPDGFGRLRTVTFDGPNLDWLSDTLTIIKDRRISGIEQSDDGLTVHFTHTSLADFRHEFPIEVVREVLEDEEIVPDPPVKKAAAKKVAKKAAPKA